MPCVFCGSATNKPSGEHVWPKWIRKLVPPDVGAADHTYVYSDTQRGEFRRVAGQPIFALKVNGVCEPCNNGWMSRTENRVKPYITNALQGGGKVLHREGQTSIAVWGVLKALVAARAFRSSPIIPDAHYSELYDLRDQGQLPESVHVTTARVGWSDRRANPGFFRTNEMHRVGSEDPDALEGYLLTFSVLDLAIQIFRHARDEPGRFSGRPGLAKSVAQIWPTGDSFTWPPGLPMTQRGLEAWSGDDAA